MDAASTSVYSDLAGIAHYFQDAYPGFDLQEMYNKQRCQEYFSNMSLKGITRNRNKKTNRLRISILTKKRHKK